MFFPVLCIAIFLFSCKEKVSETAGVTATDSTSASIDSGLSVRTDTFYIPGFDTADFTFHFNPPVGKTYTVYNASTATITSTAPDGSTEILKTEDAVTLSLSIKEKNADGNFIVELQQKNARQMMQIGDEKQEYVSGKPMSDPQADVERKLLDCMLNVPITLIMNSNAEIEETKGLDAIQKKMSAVLGDSIPAEQFPTPDPSEAVENLFLTFPEETVNTGSTWKKSLPSSIQGLPILINNTYTITERDSGIASIQFTSKITLNKKEIPAEYLPQIEGLSIQGTVSGTMQVEEWSGWTRGATATQNITIARALEGQKVSTKIAGDIVVKSQ
jgi:hypothetical protein